MTETLPVVAQTTRTRFRWVQKNNDGLNTDVWSIDSVVITQDATAFQYVAQFDINVGCGENLSLRNERCTVCLRRVTFSLLIELSLYCSISISFDFVTQDGNVSDWTKVEQECVPGYCWPSNYQKGSSYYINKGSVLLCYSVYYKSQWYYLLSDGSV